MVEKSPGAKSSPLHLAIALAVPFSFLLAMDGLLRALALSAVVPSAMPAFPVLLLAAGTTEIIAGNRLASRKATGFLARLRELLLVFIVSYVIQVVAAGGLHSLVPSLTGVGVIYGTILVLAQWLMTFAIHTALRERDFFHELARGKEGADLKSFVREFFDEAGSAVNGVRRVQRSLVVMLVAVFVLLAVGLTAGAPIGPVLLMLALVHEVLAFLGYAALNQVIEEQGLLGDGMRIPPQLLRRRLAALVAVFVGGMILALAATGKRSLFPSSVLADVLEKIGRYFASRMKMNYKVSTGGGEGGAAAQEWDLGIGRSPLFAIDQGDTSTSRAVRLISLGVLGAAGLLVLYFILRPLFSREGRASLRDAHPLRDLAARGRAILAALRESGRGFVRWLRSPRRTVSRIARTLLDGVQMAVRQTRADRGPAAGAERQRRQRLARTLREFLRIVRWGEKAGVPFRPSMGPLEYATALGGAVGGKRDELREAARAFEEIVFSNHEIGDNVLGDFYRKVDGIVRQAAGQG